MGKYLFFHAAFDCVNKNFEGFLADLGGRQEEGEISAFLSSKSEKNAAKICATSSQKRGFFFSVVTKYRFFAPPSAALTKIMKTI